MLRCDIYLAIAHHSHIDNLVDCAFRSHTACVQSFIKASALLIGVNGVLVFYILKLYPI